MDVGQNPFHHSLGCAIGIGGVARFHVFRVRDFSRIAIYRSRRAENDLEDARPCHFFGQYQTAQHIVVIILDRFGHTLANRFQAGKMNDGIDVVLGKNPP